MPAAPLPHDELERRQAVLRYGPTESAEERDPQLERIVSVAQRMAATPIAAVTLVDSDRQWFEAEIGLGIDSAQRSDAFCAHTILQQDPLTVPDARLDPRFARNSLVTDHPKVRAYAGAPLITEDGYPVGALCLFDTHPRGFSPEELLALEDLAAVVIDLLDARRREQTDDESLTSS